MTLSSVDIQRRDSAREALLTIGQFTKTDPEYRIQALAVLLQDLVMEESA